MTDMPLCDDDVVDASARPQTFAVPTAPRAWRKGRPMPTSFRGLSWAMMGRKPHAMLSQEEEKGLLLLYQMHGSQDAAQRLVEAFSGWLSGRAVDVLGPQAAASGEGFHEAVCAFLHAAERWDANTNARLASYATPFVMGALLRLTMRKGPLTIGTNLNERKAFFGRNRAVRQFADDQGRMPTPHDTPALAAIIGCTPRALRTLERWDKEEVVPLDAAMEAPGQSSPEERAMLARTLAAAVMAVRNASKPREKAILDATMARALAHGDDPQDAPSLHDLAARFGCTRERIGQIRADLLAKVRDRLAAKGVHGLHDAVLP